MASLRENRELLLLSHASVFITDLEFMRKQVRQFEFSLREVSEILLAGYE